MKTVSQLDADGYYVGTTTAQRSPLEQGVFLIPGGAVDAFPPVVPQGKRARWSDGWVLEDAPAPETEPAPTLDEVRQAKIAQIDRARDAALEAGFLFDGVRYDCDDLSVQRITGAAVLGILNPAFTTPWITFDNSVVTLSATDLAGLGAAAAQHVATQLFKARELKDDVLAATTAEQVAAINW